MVGNQFDSRPSLVDALSFFCSSSLCKIAMKYPNCLSCGFGRPIWILLFLQWSPSIRFPTPCPFECPYIAPIYPHPLVCLPTVTTLTPQNFDSLSFVNGGVENQITNGRCDIVRSGVYVRAETDNVRFGTGRLRFACRMICWMSSRGSEGRGEGEG